MKWENYFDDNILKRGERYYRKGKVIDFKSDGRKRTATVIGNDEYSVLVEFDRSGDLVDMECDCPYAANGEYCKHMVAVLCYESYGAVPGMEEKRGAENKLQKSQEPKKESRLVTISKTRLNLEILKEEIKEIIAFYKRRGYIEYRYAYDCAMQVMETMETNAAIYLGEGRYKEAFDYSFFVLRKFCAIEMDDSDGGTGILCNVGVEIWEQAIQDVESENYIFEKLLKYNASDKEWYLKEQAEDFLLTKFDKPEFYERKMQYVEKRIEEIGNQTDWFEYKRGYYLKHKLDLMRKLNVSEKIFEKFRQEYWCYAEVQADFIEENIQRNQYKKAESLLLDCLTLSIGTGVSTKYFRERLLFIYKETGDNEAYRKILMDYVLLEGGNEIEKYEELKQLYSTEEWPTIRENVIQSIWKNNRELLPEILLREGMKDRLLKMAVSYPNLYYIQKYEKELMQEYPKEVLEKYKKEFQKLTEYASTRDTYREIVRQLRKLNRYKEGKDFVREIIAEWRIKFPRRKAMMEELNKIVLNNQTKK